ncbi:hypothetical protein MAJ_11171, partial [Metarhizium majus ARSEF 297]
MPYHAEWEEYIRPFRENRRLLVARNIDFNATRAEFQDHVRAKLTKPGSVIFLWPPAPAQYNNFNNHIGWMMLGSSAAAKSASTEQADLPIALCRALLAQTTTLPLQTPPRPRLPPSRAPRPLLQGLLLSIAPTSPLRPTALPPAFSEGGIEAHTDKDKDADQNHEDEHRKVYLDD